MRRLFLDYLFIAPILQTVLDWIRTLSSSDVRELSCAFIVSINTIYFLTHSTYQYSTFTCVILLGIFVFENKSLPHIMEFVKILHSNETYCRKFRTYGTQTTFKFNPVPSSKNEIDWLKNGFNELVEKMKAEASDNDHLGFTLTSLNFKNRDPGYVAFRPATQVHGDLLWEIFGGIIQSNSQSIQSNDTFKIQCTRVNLPIGAGKVRPGLFDTFEEECSKRRGIVRIQNTDNLCLPRALVVAKAYAKKKDESTLALLRKDRRLRQTIEAKKLMANAGVQIPEEGAGIPELIRFQAHLKKYNIVVYNYSSKGRDVYFDGENRQTAQYNINLLFNKGHYNVINSLTAAFACDYFCEACHTPYKNRTDHVCKTKCFSCFTTSPPCALEHEGIVCPDCNRHFKNQLCFIAHQGGVCRTVKKCLECQKNVFVKKRKSKHVCGEVYCKTCRDFKEQNHKCYMQKDTRNPMKEDYLFIFFDLETRQDEALSEDPDVSVHKVNLCVSKQYCWKCINNEDYCDVCNERTHIFRSDPIVKFMAYIMEVRKQFRSVCVIAHNGRGFDFQFIMKYILENTKFTPNLITRGTKVLLMQIDNVRFIDSLSYFPMSLSVLPKALDLPPEKKKGYFPHLFNTLANQNYVGPMPPSHYYCPDSMFDKNFQDFHKWYNDQVCSRYTFDFQKELLEYCLSDVDILAQACIKFRTIFLDQCNVDPFLEAITIASACGIAFRRNFLKPESIGLIPKNGYRLKDVHSKISLQWMCLEEEQRNVTIEHAGRGPEIKINGMKVDGFDGTHVYEFNGCYFHGCPECFPFNRDEALKDDPSDTLNQRYERTKAKLERLSQTEYETVVMWECEFNRMKTEKKLCHLENHPMLNTLPLNPRDAFYGGRTGNTKTYHKCGEGEQINYVDVCSLYPYVCKYGKYPIGHPTIHVGDQECIEQGMEVDGLLKCKVLPPQNLYHPVLPTRMNNKLMFVLCRTCGETQNPNDCDHSSEERELSGTWTMVEIRKAIEKGYKIIEMYELWQYKVATFKDGGLFTEFIDKFLKIKQEASGYPSWVNTEDDKDRYIKQYLEHEGILLDKEKIIKNEGLRFLAKLMLNSFWGYFGQRENQTKTLITRDPKEYFNAFTTPESQVNYVQFINEEALWLNWNYLDEVGDSLRTANVVLAAYTTAQARLQLYKHLDALGEQVIYYDTDSVFYLYKQGMHKVPTGDYLGQMTDELAEYGEGSYISEFVSGGPKTYAYLINRTNDEIKAVCKVKGITLNHKTEQIVNFDALKTMVFSDREEESMSVRIAERRIRRTNEKDVVTVTETKDLRITGPKRRHEGEYDTLPYGFKKHKHN